MFKTQIVLLLKHDLRNCVLPLKKGKFIYLLLIDVFVPVLVKNGVTIYFVYSSSCIRSRASGILGKKNNFSELQKTMVKFLVRFAQYC